MSNLPKFSDPTKPQDQKVFNISVENDSKTKKNKETKEISITVGKKDLENYFYYEVLDSETAVASLVSIRDEAAIPKYIQDRYFKFSFRASALKNCISLSCRMSKPESK